MSNEQNCTKAKSLLHLIGKLHHSVIPELLVINKYDWDSEKYSHLKTIKIKFLRKTVAIRSSAFNEDTRETSNAGAFKSILGINPEQIASVSSAIDEVFDSYGCHASENDEVIIQQMVENILFSGVVLTHELKNGAPYYSINYDDISGKSDTVTAGLSHFSNKTLYIHRENVSALRSERFSKLMRSIVEIEKINKSEHLDIEFIVQNDLTVNIVQVRPIAAQSSINAESRVGLKNKIKQLREEFKDLHFHINPSWGRPTIYGQMPDWNPAELIGLVPRELSCSLYKTLITDEVWANARTDMDYSEPNKKKLMEIFAGHPFIDVGTSFSSFIPKTLKRTTAAKLVKFWLQKLEDNPNFHDKIEFDIAITCFSFDLPRKIGQLPREMFNSAERNQILESYRQHLCAVYDNQHAGSIQNSINKIDEIDFELSNLKSGKNDNLKSLLELCRDFGTRPFATLARHAFIGTSMIRSLQAEAVLTEDRTNEFFGSIQTVLTQLLRDFADLQSGAIQVSEFFLQYGHLRAGTYDITSPNYRHLKISDFFGKSQSTGKHTKFSLTNSERQEINELIRKFELPMESADELFDYIRKSICARERAKFEFTKIIDAIFDRIIQTCNEIKMSIDDASFLSIDHFLAGENEQKRLMRGELEILINDAKRRHSLDTFIKLPQLLIDPDNAVVIPFQAASPNFVTNLIVEAESIKIEMAERAADLNNKIVLIEGADPGYDWIFTTRFVGLITKFGGANSHMAIRCAEMQIPAAIGCGEQIYDSLSASNRIFLNCASRQINRI